MMFPPMIPRIYPSILTLVNRTGPGRRTIATLHKKIRDDATRNTPGAERMRKVVERRRANWS